MELLFGLTSLVLVVPAYAADSPTGEHLGTMSVTAAPIIDPQPLNTTFVDGADLRTLRPATSDAVSLLRDTPGVSLSSAGGVSSLPVIHGMADDRVRVRVDGMDLISACANHMNPALSYIDPSNVDSIQVFAGITPVSVGGDSIGGTIQVNSTAPEFAQAGQGTLLKGQAGVFYRSNGNVQGGNFLATTANEQLSLTYNGSTVESNNYKAAKDFKAAGPAATGRGWLAGDEVGSSRYKAENHALGLAWLYENHLVELKLGLQDIPYQGFPNQHMDMTGNDSQQINLHYDGKYQWGTMEARIYNENTRHKMNFADDKNFYTLGMPMDTEGKNTGVLAKADMLLSKRDIIRIGGEYQRYRLNDWWPPVGTGGMSPETFWNINNGERDRFDIFGEWEARWNPQWLSQLGVRSDTVKMDTGMVNGYKITGTSNQYVAESTAFNNSNRQRTDHNWDLTALSRYTPDDRKTFEFGYAQKSRSPNLYERYTWSTGGMAMAMNNLVNDGNGYVGNLNLKPEVAHTLSATADWHDVAQKQWGLKITPYYTYVQDYIDAGRCSSANTGCGAANQLPAKTTGFVHLQFINQSARLYGVDVSGYFPLAKTDDYGSFTAKGMLNYVNGKNETTGDNLYNIMPLNAKLTIEQRWDNWTNSIEGQLVDAKRDVSQVRDEVKTGGYALLNLRSSYEWRQFRVDAGVENVLDKFYAHPLSGAYIGQGSTMSLNATSALYGIPVPGMGRSVYTGVTVKF
ncbi:MAG: TonB-dependent receptor [Deltaproteobacteria bacterium RIFOXYD12_FULL_53_23]|nr:MAG: TonB-dependent receptor [Deltaproteobacteria bacterium RIFOXYD12_FULL_53_23]